MHFALMAVLAFTTGGGFTYSWEDPGGVSKGFVSQALKFLQTVLSSVPLALVKP